jgi:broad specificity phosphatase PhoE
MSWSGSRGLILSSEWCIGTVRHGETDYNIQNRYAGTIDVELNEQGRTDARAASARLGQMRFDVTVTSPLKRAMETAQILTGGRIETIPCSYARERDFGVLQGVTASEVEHIRPPIHFVKVGGDYHSIDPPNAETFEEVRARAAGLRSYLLGDFNGRRVLVVSHGVFLQQFHGVMRGQDWLEALGKHVGNLELTLFNMRDDTLLSEEHIPLTERAQSDF